MAPSIAFEEGTAESRRQTSRIQTRYRRVAGMAGTAPVKYTFTAVYVEATDGKTILAYVEELPGAHAQGATIDEAELHLRDSLDLTLRANRKRTAAVFRGLRV